MLDILEFTLNTFIENIIFLIILNYFVSLNIKDKANYGILLTYCFINIVLQYLVSEILSLQNFFELSFIINLIIVPVLSSLVYIICFKQNNNFTKNINNMLNVILLRICYSILTLVLGVSLALIISTLNVFQENGCIQSLVVIYSIRVLQLLIFGTIHKIYFKIKRRRKHEKFTKENCRKEN